MNKDNADGKVPFYQRFIEKKKTVSSVKKKNKTGSGASASGPGKGRNSPGKTVAAGKNLSSKSTGCLSSREQFPALQVRQTDTVHRQPVILSSLFAEIPADAAALLADFDNFIQKALPLTGKQFRELPADINRLSHYLTDERSDLRMGYMNEAPSLSAYVRYFMWWNLIRLTPVFASLAPGRAGIPLALSDNSVLLDVGSGPLTIPCALWLARPDLRCLKLTWFCLDYSQNALNAGEEIFLSLVAATGGVPWKIVRIKGAFGTELREKADVVFCANMFNELYWNSNETSEALVKEYTRILFSYASPSADFMVIEPGVPRCGRFISLLRETLLRRDYIAAAPCLHQKNCPMPGTKGSKWCHFVLDASVAPEKLGRLSAESGLPKDRASFSFLFAVKTRPELVPQTPLEDERFFPVRITSDLIRLGDTGRARYGCSHFGLTLAGGQGRAGYTAAAVRSGDVIQAACPVAGEKPLPVDKKSGAVLAEPRQQ